MPRLMTLPIRPAVQASPDYPFNPIDAPVKLDQNESAEDFPAELKALAAERLAALPWNRYPDLHSDALCAAIARHDEWDGGVVVTTGSNVLIPLLAQLSGLGRRIVTVKPGFALYALGATLLDIPLTEVPLNEDFTMNVPALIDAVRSADASAGGVLYLAQPHAPTGSSASIEEIERIVDAAPSWLVVIDEAYHQFSSRDFRQLARRHGNVVLLRTFSKAWGLAGLRLGYVLASSEVARQLRKLIPPFATSVMQTVAAQVALEHPGYVRERARQLIRERDRIYAALQGHPSWRVFPSDGNFLLIRTPDAQAAHRHLLAHGVLVRRQDSYHGLAGCIRMSVGTPSENDSFIAAALAASQGLSDWFMDTHPISLEARDL